MNYTIVPKIFQRLGSARASYVSEEARRRLNKIPRNEFYAEQDWRKEITVWELQMGRELAKELRPAYVEEEKEVAAADAKVLAAQKDADALRVELDLAYAEFKKAEQSSTQVIELQKIIDDLEDKADAAQDRLRSEQVAAATLLLKLKEGDETYRAELPGEEEAA